MKKQTAGRDMLGDLAPKFAELNDDLMNRNKDLYTRCHDLFPMEIEANNEGLFKAYQLMTYTKLPGKETQLMHLDYLSNLLKYDWNSDKNL